MPSYVHRLARFEDLPRSGPFMLGGMVNWDATVADMVSDWASTHVDPFVLELTGPAGGVFVRGDVPPTRVDAVEFLRIVSGRGSGDGVLANPLPL